LDVDAAIAGDAAIPGEGEVGLVVGERLAIDRLWAMHHAVRALH
jgi:hypothetical protein